MKLEEIIDYFDKKISYRNGVEYEYSTDPVPAPTPGANRKKRANELPSVKKRHIGGPILEELYDAYASLKLANTLYFEHNERGALIEAENARRTFLRAKAKILLFSQDDRSAINREFLFGLETEFLQMLGAWTNWLNKRGRR